MQVIQHPSPNCGPRRDGLVPELIVLHFTAMADTPAALERLCAPEHEVSAHYLISREGTVFQMVDEALRAWHAGAGSWAGRGDVNSRSVGVELDNCGGTPFSAAQMDALEDLMRGIMARWHIGPEAVIGHSDMAPTRKSDPGRRFDWRRLARHGLAIWPEDGAATPDVGLFLRAATRFGYNAEFGFAAVLDAFRQRFRPHAQGPLDAADMGMIQDLAARFPVDPTQGNA
ncbi:N-acetylmuramoyl-L-alanine amidase [Aliiroseovarius subalbicans]|uniref:N-acetylmuramoyl-L-alanine amidase n=1 Tax=Aliiroseovarius subalbicans TaxID=2925840 RepID=UPI001F573FC1|nr:N-acetylmuramoyl-L-alanine amidase [Aliiroseovarius subalbicans]MCI2400513.1 N-acetylmuramoyl-L-alanine amidase [Aliiroseovarius subalbicans]